jgi:hypothetical protein
VARRQAFHGFQTPRGFVEPDAALAQIIDHTTGSHSHRDVDAKLRRPCMDITAIRRRECDLAIPHDRLNAGPEVPRDPLDAALERFRTDVVFEQDARSQLEEAQRRLAGRRGGLRRPDPVFGGRRRWLRPFRDAVHVVSIGRTRVTMRRSNEHHLA